MRSGQRSRGIEFRWDQLYIVLTGTARMLLIASTPLALINSAKLSDIVHPRLTDEISRCNVIGISARRDFIRPAIIGGLAKRQETEALIDLYLSAIGEFQ
jgi:hypothetical protein